MSLQQNMTGYSREENLPYMPQTKHIGKSKHKMHIVSLIFFPMMLNRYSDRAGITKRFMSIIREELKYSASVVWGFDE